MMRQKPIAQRLLTASFIFLSAAVGIATGQTGQEGPFIAGLHPDQRPEGAPIITEVFKDQAWYAKALTGVSWPYPNSLRFLDNQGNWYTPFTRPGMIGRYDLRGWHQQP